MTDARPGPGPVHAALRRWTELRERNRRRVQVAAAADATITEALAVLRSGGVTSGPGSADPARVDEQLDRARFSRRTGVCEERCAHDRCSAARDGLALAQGLLASRGS